jgi:alkylation response protein AidB-like acyl-CoA dehydrogenase
MTSTTISTTAGPTSAEIEQLRAAVRALLPDRTPTGTAREGRIDHDLWKQMAVQMGLAGLAVPEQHGGTGSGIAELAVVMEEIGRALTPSPLLSSTGSAAAALLGLGHTDPLPALCAGETLAVCALYTSVTETGGGLTGAVDLVVDGATADLLILQIADHRFFAVDAALIERTPLISSDPTRPLCRLSLQDTAAKPLPCADPAAVAASVRDRVALLLASEQLGGMARCVETTVEYAKTRVQFGRPIGAYQAVKHRLAEMYTALELGTSLVREAQRAADHDPEAFPLAAVSARAWCDRAYQKIAQGMIQLHGGIGFTWEHDAHLYYKRARSTPLLFGGPELTTSLLCHRLGLHR